MSNLLLSMLTTAAARVLVYFGSLDVLEYIQSLHGGNGTRALALCEH